MPQGDKGATVTSATAGAPGWTVHALCMASPDKYGMEEGFYQNGIRFAVTSYPDHRAIASPSQCGLECTNRRGCL